MKHQTNYLMQSENNNSSIVNYSNELGKLPPQAIEIEEAVLGALMLERNSLYKAVDILRPEVFYKEANQEIYNAILELFSENKPIDILTVTNQLRDKVKLDIVGGAHYITNLTTRVQSSDNVEYHSRLLLEKYIKRDIIRLGSEMTNQAYEDSTDALELLDSANIRLTGLNDFIDRKKAQKFGDVLDESLKKIQDAIISDNHITGIPSGFIDLDKVTHGWQESDLIILAARPGMGKTALAIRLVAETAIKNNIPCAFFSLEMSNIQLIQRIQAGESLTYLEKIRSGELSSESYEKVKSASQKMSSAPLYIDDTPALKLIELRAKVYNLIVRYGIKMFVVDYIQLMDSTGNTRNEEVGRISRGLKAIAKEFNMPVIALSQLSRAVENRGGEKRPQLSDLRESGDIEQDADLVIFLYRPEYYKIELDSTGKSLKGVCELIIAKHRNGRLKDIWLTFDGNKQMFYDYMETLGSNDYSQQLGQKDPF